MQHIQNLAIIGLVNLLVYYRTIFFGYVGDDVERAHRKEPVFKNTIHKWWIQFIGLRHLNSMVSHFINIIVHTLCCMSIYWVLGANQISFITALLFSVNPVNIQGSIWISGRNYVTSSILCLGMFAFPYASWIFYMATSLFAVNAWFAPVAFIGTKYWYMVWIIPIVWIFNNTNKNILDVKLWQNNGLKTTNSEMRAIKPQKIIPFLKSYIYYFTLCIFPYRVGIEHAFLRGFGTNKTDNYKGYKIDFPFLAGLCVFLFVIGMSAWCVIHGWIPAVWGLFWFTVNIAMWCNFVTYQQQIAERYCYLANIGMMYALANVITPYPVIIAIFLTAYVIRLWYIMEMYLDDWWAVEYTIRDIKHGHYMWLMRGVKKFMDQDFKGAYFDFGVAYRHKPHDLKVLFNLATTCLILGDSVKAREYLELAKKNCYDELEQDVKPAFDKVETSIKRVEESRARGETQFQINLADLMVVK